MDAYCLLNIEKPANKIHVSQLAKTAGYDRTTFYQYFLDMEDLKNAVEESFTVFVQELRKNVAVQDDQFIQTMVTAYETKPLYFNALFGKYGDINYISSLSNIFKFDLVETHLPDEDKQKGYLLEFHLSTTISLFRYWLQQEKNISIEKVMSLIKVLYTKGIDGIKK